MVPTSSQQSIRIKTDRRSIPGVGDLNIGIVPLVEVADMATKKPGIFPFMISTFTSTIAAVAFAFLDDKCALVGPLMHVIGIETRHCVFGGC